MHREKTQGIILHSIPYLNEAKIQKVFTLDLGMISILVKGKKKLSSLHPMAKVELLIKRSEHSDLYQVEDFSFLSSFEKLRESLELLQAFTKMGKALLQTQREEKKPELYLLFLQFLQRLEKGAPPTNLIASFYGKLLYKEGLLHLSETCLTCGGKAASISQGVSLCLKHSSSPFLQEDFEALKTLVFSKKLKEIENTSFSQSFFSFMESFLEESINLHL